ncbi:MAG: peroxide stress protein YaaA [Mangrovibacterium sp.]
MITIISPAKLLDFSKTESDLQHTNVQFSAEAVQINAQLKKRSVIELMHLHGISFDLAAENERRNQDWACTFLADRGKQSLLAFDGAVYRGIDASSFGHEDFEFAQRHLRILSGLYGVLRPLDLIEPYRLEMGTSINILGKKSLYDFWEEKITTEINRLMELNDGVLINLASEEYFKVIDRKKIKGRIITPQFKEKRNDTYKTIVIYAKQARGMMCRFMIKNKLQIAEELMAFDYEGYYFNNDLSKGDNWIFTRDK